MKSEDFEKGMHYAVNHVTRGLLVFKSTQDPSDKAFMPVEISYGRGSKTGILLERITDILKISTTPISIHTLMRAHPEAFV